MGKKGGPPPTTDIGDTVDRIAHLSQDLRVRRLRGKQGAITKKVNAGDLQGVAEMLVEMIKKRDAWVMGTGSRQRVMPKAKTAWEAVIENPNLFPHRDELWALMKPMFDDDEQRDNAYTLLQERGWEIDR